MMYLYQNFTQIHYITHALSDITKKKEISKNKDESSIGAVKYAKDV